MSQLTGEPTTAAVAPHACPPDRRRSVTMIVNNPCTHDSRVIKEAESTAAAGFRVTVVCRAAKDVPDLEKVNGVTYRRIPRVRGARILNMLVQPRLDAGRRTPTILFRLVRLGQSIYWTTKLLTRVVAKPRIRFEPMGEAAGPPRPTFRRRVIRVAKRVLRPARPVLLPIKPQAKSAARWGLRRARSMAGRLRRLVRRTAGLMLRIANAVRTSMVRRVLRRIGLWLSHEEARVSLFEAIVVDQPELIHANDLDTLPAATHAAAAIDAAVVYDAHEYEVSRADRRAWLDRWFIRREEGRHVRTAAGVITVSRGIAERLADLHGIPEPKVVYNAPYVGAGTTTADVRSDLGFPDDRPIALYVGKVKPNLAVLPKALPHMPGMHIVCVGPRVPAIEQKLTAIARETGSQDRLHFLDPQLPENVVDYVRTADLAVIPTPKGFLSTRFGMPNKLFECALAGLPIAVSDLPEMGRFVEDHELGLRMDVGDPGSVAETIRNVHARRGEFRPDAERLAELRDRYGWHQQARTLTDLYQSIIGPADARGDADGEASDAAIPSAVTAGGIA